ncbi:hypothetical protein PGTUg99_030711 [Puccinia graminis f. sp. tritici]|uniref:Uncharacterized protein n=1 Tax=Puccinia graminis f. sp. tritici TaxID=56615 RepID=A0A5B0SJU8_PUCGR|nr:hypothetical protein PGTUg99_030711 [Puccinia graminis f. sp. tritici]
MRVFDDCIVPITWLTVGSQFQSDFILVASRIRLLSKELKDNLRTVCGPSRDVPSP